MGNLTLLNSLDMKDQGDEWRDVKDDGDDGADDDDDDDDDEPEGALAAWRSRSLALTSPEGAAASHGPPATRVVN